MNIIFEVMEGQNYLEITLTRKELSNLLDKFSMITALCEIGKDVFSIGVRAQTKGEEDAASKRKK